MIATIEPKQYHRQSQEVEEGNPTKSSQPNCSWALNNVFSLHRSVLARHPWVNIGHLFLALH